MEYIPAAMLWLLTLVRLPTATNNDRAPLFRATIFAAIACTLFIPAVYNATDPALGGHNRIGLILIITILIAFWQFHTASVLAALTADERRRRRHLAWGQAAFAVAATSVVAGFLTSHVDTTNQALPLAYGDQPGMRLFLWAGSAFIMWSCIDVAITCYRFIPTIRSKVTRSGTVCFASGCVVMAMALADRLAVGAPALGTGETRILDASFPVLESVAVILVSVGLIQPRTFGLLSRLQFDLKIRQLLLTTTHLWRRSNRANARSSKMSPSGALAPMRTHPLAHLHRHVIDIRDSQLRGLALEPRDRALIVAAENLLEQPQ